MRPLVHPAGPPAPHAGHLEHLRPASHALVAGAGVGVAGAGPYPTRGRQDIRGVPGSHISLPEVEKRGPDLCTQYRSCFQCFQRDLTTLNIL